MRCDVDTANAKPDAASESLIDETTAEALGGDTAADAVTVADDEVPADSDDTSDAEEGAAGDKPARRSRSRRYKDRIARLEHELAEARGAAHVPERLPPVFRQGHAPFENDDDLVAPSAHDYA